MSLKDRVKTAVAAFDARARPWAGRSRWRGWLYEFLMFGLKQAWACLFGASLLVLILATHLFWPASAPLARYDFLVIAAVVIQIVFLVTRLEYMDEAIVIVIFHVVGTCMELFKTAHGSWLYPEHNLLRLGGVPLFSGFMYASIGSFIARIQRLLDIRFEAYPPIWAPWLLAIASYANFFTHHFWPDARNYLFAFSALIFLPTRLCFTPDRIERRMPLIVGAVLVAFFIWVAENLGTFAGAWVYPGQRSGWSVVPLAKMGAWYLLIMLSFVLVTLVRPPVRFRDQAQTASGLKAVETL